MNREIGHVYPVQNVLKDTIDIKDKKGQYRGLQTSRGGLSGSLGASKRKRQGGSIS